MTCMFCDAVIPAGAKHWKLRGLDASFIGESCGPCRDQVWEKSAQGPQKPQNLTDRVTSLGHVETYGYQSIQHAPWWFKVWLLVKFKVSLWRLRWVIWRLRCSMRGIFRE